MRRIYRGERAIDVLAAEWSTTQLVAGLTQVEVNRDQVISGRKEVYAILQEASQSTRGTGGKEGEEAGDSKASAVGISDADVGASGNEALSGIMMFLTWFPFFHHLWFLWFLCWLVLAFALYAKLADLLRWKAPRSLVISPATIPVADSTHDSAPINDGLAVSEFRSRYLRRVVANAASDVVLCDLFLFRRVLFRLG